MQRLSSSGAHSLAVVILTHNRVEELLHTIARTAALPECPEIVVVDNGSTDGSAQRAAECFPSIRVLALEKNFGAAARNLGAQAVSAEYVAFSDDDTAWAPGSLARAAAILASHPRIGVLSARILVGAERRDDPACLVMGASPLLSAGLPGRAVIGFMAGASVFRRRAFLEAGGYEPRFFIGGEEALLALDLLVRGWDVVYSDALTVHHRPSAKRDAAARSRFLVRNALWVAWLRRTRASVLRHLLGTLVRCAGEPAALHGCIDALWGLPWVLRNRRVIPAHVEAACRQVEIWLRDNETAGLVPGRFVKD
jgi:GT2 family glycosyltransferase